MRYLLALIVFFLFVSCGNEYTPTVVSARKDASDIGVEIMKKGGNAFDAMIGVQLALSKNSYRRRSNPEDNWR